MIFKSIYLFFLFVLITHTAFSQSVVLDNLETTDGWSFIKSDGVNLSLSNEKGYANNAIRLDYDFTKGTGYGGFQKNISIDLPENYEISFWVKADSPANNFEIKFLDASGDNVWWQNFRNYTFPTEWRKIKIKKRHIHFAWGPNFNEKPPKIDRIEFTIASFVGGKGTLWIDDLKFEKLPPETDTFPQPTVSVFPKSKTNIKAIFDTSTATTWFSKNAKKQAILIDFQQKIEFGGININWHKNANAKDFGISLSNDGTNWEKVFHITDNQNNTNIISLPEAEAKFIRIDLNTSHAKKNFGINDIKLLKLKESETPNKFIIYNAKNAEKGHYPSYFSEQASYFTVSGVNNDVKEAMISQNGMVEVDKALFSLEPMFELNNKLYNWNNVEISQFMGKSTMQKEFQFIPGVNWKFNNISFSTEITSGGEANKNSNLLVKYTFKNTSTATQTFNFYLLLRPFQVNPYYQDLNLIGGVGKINAIKSIDNHSVQVDDKTVFSSLPFHKLALFSSKDSDIVSLLKDTKLNNRTTVTDPLGLASGILQYPLTLKANETQTFFVKVPFYTHHNNPTDISTPTLDNEFNEYVDFWNSKINHIKFNLPTSADKIINTFKSQLVYILINRDNAGIQPGSRSYERSWIRDGSLTSSALLKSGIVNEVREYIEWYSNYLYEDGKVPCVVDHRGPDPVPENDSHGQFIYLIKEYYNFTKDLNFLREKNPKILHVVSYIEKLIAERSTEYYRKGNDSIRAQYGLVPESISHEGYSAKPMHSYWDNFFTIKGLKDAVEIQKLLGNKEEEIKIAKLRDTFTVNLYNSIILAMKNHNINYIPGCAELGDFDATSTTVALSPCNEILNLPKPQIYNTFDKYYDYFVKRKNNTTEWVNYTPYENRVIGSFIMLNQPDKAHELIDFFLNDLKPKAWNHWAEVVWKNDQFPGFVGDMPHTWVGSDFVNSIRSMFVYENEMDKSLVLAAALYQDWIDTPKGMSVENLPTYFGTLSYFIKKEGNKYHFEIEGDLKLPENGIKIQNFNGSKMPTKVLVNGKEIKSFTNNVIQIQQIPTQVEIFYND